MQYRLLHALLGARDEKTVLQEALVKTFIQMPLSDIKTIFFAETLHVSTKNSVKTIKNYIYMLYYDWY